ncbi:MAG: SCP2 sterol-binding domain-containing protein [Candidatus Eremiobacteraeota bacterium]|nr:SCP2 sterol-binding domain-containing protein [Candidatus Eremiobacteraeota bacterium]
MPAFQNQQHARDILRGFFQQEAGEDDKIFAGSGLIVGYDLRDPDVHVILDASKPPQAGKSYDVYVDDAGAPSPTVDFTLSADDFDKLYKGEIQVMGLVMTGRAKAKGDMTAAMRLLPALARVIPRYRKYRETH